MIAELEPGQAPRRDVTPGDMVGEMQDLPLAPKVLPRLKRLLSDPNSTLQEIAGLIRLDPAIAARVLQVANSAYYSSQGERCFTVDDAVRRVGFNEVYELVAYAVASQVLVRPLEIYDLEADDLWRSSVCCALAAEALAARTGQDRDVAYTAGLLHAVGMVVIDGWALKNGRVMKLRDTGFPHQADASETAVFGFTHAETGAVLLENWDFPASISEPVRWQQSPAAAGEHDRMTSLLYAARWLRCSVCRGAAVNPDVPAAILDELSLDQAALQEIADEVKIRLAEVSSLLESSDEDAKPAQPQPAQRYPKKK